MRVDQVPAALRERLGDAGTVAFVETMESRGREWKTEVIAVVSDRSERRLSEECGVLRLEMTTGFAAVRHEMAAEFAAVRHEMAAGFGAVRQEFAAVRQEIADTRVEIAGVKLDIIKWSFVFCVGQVVVIGGLMAILLRATSGS